MFRAVHEKTRKPSTKQTIHVDAGHFIWNAAELNARITEHLNSADESLPTFVGRLAWLQQTITANEIQWAIGKLNRGRASTRDYVVVELMKCTTGLPADTIASIFNDALEWQ